MQVIAATLEGSTSWWAVFDGLATDRVIHMILSAWDIVFALLVNRTITDDYYDHRDADRDLNLVFPVERFRELVEEGIVGRLVARHFSFMGRIEGLLVRRLEHESIPRLLGRLGAEQPDFVFLVPA